VALHYTGLEMRFLDLCGFPDAMTSTTVKDGSKGEDHSLVVGLQQAMRKGFERHGDQYIAGTGSG